MDDSISRFILILESALALGCLGTGEPPPETDLELVDLAGQPSGVQVMTQNLYVGFDVYPLAFAPFDQLPTVVAESWEDFLTNRPEDRMAAIAGEIALLRPHLVGLQEVTRIYEQSPSDTVLGQLAPNATDEYVNFLAVLLHELASRGLDYEVAAEKLGADIEVPRLDDVVDGVPIVTDVRATFSDVILRRAGTPTAELFAINYAAALPFPPIPGALVRRNAVGVTADIGGETIRFASTHLEPLLEILPDDAQPQYPQVAELISLLETSFEPELPTILVGDFNSPADTGKSYLQISAADFTDIWTLRDGPSYPGLTCCQEELLTHPDSVLYERIDQIWIKGLALKDPVLAFTIGDHPLFRTWSKPRLWPSDHAGVIAALRFATEAPAGGD
jgi:hypothetical protein